jgi:putative ABC transport system ATP-binding protein
VTPLLTARGLRRTYEAELAPTRALRGADVTVSAGELVALTGPSGCGKSTLLRVVAGLEPPDEGVVEIAGEVWTGRGPDELARLRRRTLGVVFQSYRLLEGMTALENVALPAVLAGVRARAAEGRAREVLDVLGLGDKAGASPATLSGGQRQRLAIARALVNDPPLVLADEPTGALDSTSTAEILGLFRRLNAEGRTILLVTHDPEVAGACGRVLHMRDGVVAAAGP